MKKIATLLAAVALMLPLWSDAQIVTSSPAILQESSTGVTLTYHAASPLGNRAFVDAPASTQVYAHIGVLTNLSSSWSHVVTPWPERDGSNADAANTDKNHLTAAGNDDYTLYIGDIRTYFGITDPAEHVERIALVFRNSDGSIEGKTASGGDIFVDVLPEGFAMSFSTDLVSTVIAETTTATFTVAATAPADLTIDLDGTVIASAAASTSLSKACTFDAKGYYNVTATATSAAGEVQSQTIAVAWPTASSPAPYPGGEPQQGAVSNPDGSVTFCLAAPGKQSVILVPSWDDYAVSDSNVMAYCDAPDGNRYFWITVTGLAADQWYPYYYLVDGVTPVADPYARLVLDCYSDKWLDAAAIWPEMPRYPYDRLDNVMLAVYRGDIDAYDWTDSSFVIPDHSRLVVYELLLRDFTGTVGEANGNGTLRQAIEKIPYLAELGVNAVELMPVMEFNGNNSWGYNTNFYFAPDKAYGSPDDYREFIDLCHAHGIAVILDIVFNQSDGLHPWYQMYPVGQNPFYNAEAPHAYSVLNDWNQGGNPLVERQWGDALRYWMKAYHADGFRFDLVKGLGDNDSYGGGTDGYNASRIARMKRLHQVILSVNPRGIHINEDLAQPREEIELGNDGQLQWANLNSAAGRLAAGWNAGESGIPGSLSYGSPMSAFLSTADGGRPWGSTVSYAESHDEQRVGYFVDSSAKNNTVRNASYRRLGVLAAEMLLTPGPKMIWQFGELGDAQNTKGDGGNDTSPKTVVWNLLDDPAAAGLHDCYMTLCRLRLANPELFGEDAAFVTSGIDDPLSVARTMRLTAGTREVVALINASITAQSKTVTSPVTAATPDAYTLLYASDGVDVAPVCGDGTISARLPGGSFALFASPGTPTAVTDPVIDPVDGPVEYYTIQGIRVGRPSAAGLYLVRKGDKVGKLRVQ